MCRAGPANYTYEALKAAVEGSVRRLGLSAPGVDLLQVSIGCYSTPALVCATVLSGMVDLSLFD